jgi:hypothetical protein
MGNRVDNGSYVEEGTWNASIVVVVHRSMDNMSRCAHRRQTYPTWIHYDPIDV